MASSVRVSLLLLLLCVLPFSQCVIKVDTNTQRLVDEYGRQRVFHGVNAVYKIAPWHPIVDHFDPKLSLADEDIAQFKQWGFNAVRLGVMWPGIAPEKGQFNASYLAVMKGIVDKLAQNGIYTIIDSHQDVFNRRFCGEGAPDWAVELGPHSLPFPVPALGVKTYPLDNNSYPSLDDCLQHIFALYYLSEECSAAFQSLYSNTSGIQAYFADYWSYLSSAFNASEYVLGYELLNEPWVGDIFRDPTLLKPGVADQKNLQPMYEVLNAAIRENDDEHIIFFERTLWVDLIPGIGFTTGPGGPAYNDRQVFSYHVYCGSDSDSEGNPRNVIFCDAYDTYLYTLNIEQARTLGCGSFLTEFGAMGNSSNALENLAYLTSLADLFFQSWTYWQYKLFNDITTQGPAESFYDANGNLVESKVKELSRTYATAIAGDGVSMKFDSETASFVLVYKLNTTISQPTEIYLNEDLYYPNGYSITLSPGGIAQWKSPERNRIFVQPTPSATNGSLLTVSILAK